MERCLLYSQSPDLNVNLMQETLAQKHPKQCLTKHLGTVAQPSRCIQLTIGPVLTFHASAAQATAGHCRPQNLLRCAGIPKTTDPRQRAA